MPLDKYDFVLLDIIHSYKKSHHNELIRLTTIESSFWTRIENDDSHHTIQANVGERITRLYLDGYVTTRNGYTLTRKGREELQMIAEEQG